MDGISGPHLILRACECLVGAVIGVRRCRHRRMVLDDGLAGAPVSSVTPVDNGGQMVERVGISVIELASRSTSSGCRGHDGAPQGKGTQHIVGEREPQQHGASLGCAAHRQPGEPHAARPGIGAFGLRALLVERFAGFARHALAPVRHPWFVVAPRRVGIGAVLAVRRWAPQFDAALMRPFDILVLGKAAIDQVIRRRRPGRAPIVPVRGAPSHGPSQWYRCPLRR